ncbi:MAG TPA: hypothetical protein VIJ51_19345 [Solirubrobacteraceae bacterium]
MLSVRSRRLLPCGLAVIAVLCFAAPQPAVAMQKAIWGPAVHDGVSLFPTYRQLGVTIYEDDLDWNLVAPTRPQTPTDPSDPAYHWPSEVTSAVAQAARYHISVTLQLRNTPGWANAGKASNWAPINPKDFAAFATAAAHRYPGVHLWMIWGEPSRQPNFMPLVPARPGARLDAAQQQAPHIYAQLLDAAYGALKKVSAKNIVIGGCTYTTGDIDTLQWIENMRLPDGRPPRLDLYAHNPFSFREPNFANPPSPQANVDFSDLKRLEADLNRHLRPGLKLFLSEWTVPTAIDQEFNFFVKPSVQAQWITDALSLARADPQIYALGWIHLYDAGPVTYGGLIEADGRHKPGFAAWAKG